MCFSTPSRPAVPPPPPPQPQPVSAAEERTASRRAQQGARSLIQSRRGRASTILTSPLGIQEEANVQRKTILGA